MIVRSSQDIFRIPTLMLQGLLLLALYFLTLGQARTAPLAMPAVIKAFVATGFILELDQSSTPAPNVRRLTSGLYAI
jgi:hypothetical protein